MKIRVWLIATFAAFATGTTALHAAKIHLPAKDDQQSQAPKASREIDLSGAIRYVDKDGNEHVIPLEGNTANAQILYDPETGVAHVIRESHIEDPHSTPTAAMLHVMDTEVRKALEQMQTQTRAPLPPPMLMVNGQPVFTSTTAAGNQDTSNGLIIEFNAPDNEAAQLRSMIESAMQNPHMGGGWAPLHAPDEFDRFFEQMRREMLQDFGAMPMSPNGMQPPAGWGIGQTLPPSLGNTQQPHMHSFFGSQGNGMPMSSMNLEDKGDHYEIRIQTGGQPQNVNVKLQGNMLMVSGEKKNINEIKDAQGNVVSRNESQQSFNHMATLPDDINPDSMTKKIENNTLIINVSKQAAKKEQHLRMKREGGVI
ncbi:Hsp20/alpha crystallin family protein [Candidatus Sumerlaeota bacterium]|nr:Hsp20/alpha crystallin family protein [Candidatus Sumerlaeota bacterium]